MFGSSPSCQCLHRHVTSPAHAGSRGFTVLEMTVALALVGILTSIALPSWTAFRTRALTQQAVQDITVMQVNIKRFQDDSRTYPASLADVELAGRLDPWGRAYRYLKLEGTNSNGQARKDHSLVPINSDYDLYSVGPDGETVSPLTAAKSQDDVVRANDGRYVGVASAY